MPVKPKLSTKHVSFRVSPLVREKFQAAIDLEGVDTSTYLITKVLELIEKHEERQPEIFREIEDRHLAEKTEQTGQNNA
jgi:hypothetical protein